jgi:hypothetical protein
MATSHYILVLLSVVAVLASSSVASRGPGANNSRDIQGLGGNNDSHCIRGKTTGTTTTNGASGQGQNNEHDHYDQEGNNNNNNDDDDDNSGNNNNNDVRLPYRRIAVYLFLKTVVIAVSVSVYRTTVSV